MPVYVPNPDPAAASPAELMEDLGAYIAARYAQAEQDMIERVNRLIRFEVLVPDAMVNRGRILAALRREGQDIAAGLLDPQRVYAIIAIASREGQAAAAHALGMGGRITSTSAITGVQANAVTNIGLDLISRLEDMSVRITRWMPDVYQQAVNLLTPEVILGNVTILEAQKRVVENLLARGVGGFVDSAGKNWKIGTYAEMATRTAVNRAWMDSNIYAAQQQGINLCTIVVGSGACKACAVWTGRILSTDGTPAGQYEFESAIGGGPVTVTVAATLADARVHGWNHPNCRCVTVAYQPGLPITKGSTYSPKAEADRARLRELERRVRDLKRRKAAALDDITEANLGRRIRLAQKNIRAHTAETGLMRRNYREQLSFSDGTKFPNGSNPAPVGPRALTP